MQPGRRLPPTDERKDHADPQGIDQPAPEQDQLRDDGRLVIEHEEGIGGAVLDATGPGCVQRECRQEERGAQVEDDRHGDHAVEQRPIESAGQAACGEHQQQVEDAGQDHPRGGAADRVKRALRRLRQRGQRPGETGDQQCDAEMAGGRCAQPIEARGDRHPHDEQLRQPATERGVTRRGGSRESDRSHAHEYPRQPQPPLKRRRYRTGPRAPRSSCVGDRHSRADDPCRRPRSQPYTRAKSRVGCGHHSRMRLTPLPRRAPAGSIKRDR